VSGAAVRALRDRRSDPDVVALRKLDDGTRPQPGSVMDASPLERFWDHNNRLGAVVDRYDGIARVIAGPCGAPLTVIWSSGAGWDHVSVSSPRRCPNWEEMEWVKKRTLGDAVAMQLHVAADDHISVAHTCLHIWRPHDGSIPLPPKAFVA